MISIVLSIFGNLILFFFEKLRIKEENRKKFYQFLAKIKINSQERVNAKNEIDDQKK